MSLVARRPASSRSVVLACTCTSLRLYSGGNTKAREDHATKEAHRKAPGALHPARDASEQPAQSHLPRITNKTRQAADNSGPRVDGLRIPSQASKKILGTDTRSGSPTNSDLLGHSAVSWNTRGERVSCGPWRDAWKWTDHTSCFADLQVKASSPLGKRPGLTQFLNLRPLEKTPGMVFDLQSEALSTDERFPERLHYVRDAVHHEVKPWIEKHFKRNAEAWRRLDKEDFMRVRHEPAGKAMNRTHTKHRGQMLSHTASMLSMATPRLATKLRLHAFTTRWPDNLGVELPSRWLAHLDGMALNDATVFTEFHGETPTLSSILFAINSSFAQAQGTWAALAQGERGVDMHARISDVDAFTPLLINFGRWLKRAYNNQKASLDVCTNLSGPRNCPIPLLRDSIPEGHAIPVLFAFRQKYIWFLWEGGIEGHLEAQYASHWLPVWPGEDYDGKVWRLQQVMLERFPAQVDQVPVTSSSPRQNNVKTSSEPPR